MDPNSPQPPASAPQPINTYEESSGGGSMLKKILLLVVGIVVLILIIIGGIMIYRALTGGNAQKDVTLVYWGIWEDAAVMAPVIADFERENPKIKIRYEKQDIKGLGHYVDRLKTRVNNGTGPDIVRFHSSWTQQLRRELLPFPQSTVDAIQLEKDYYKTVERDMKLDGAYYGVPLGIDTLSLFINPQLLAGKGLENPQDWNDIYIKYAPELVVKDAEGKITGPAISLGTFDNITHAPDIVALLLLQNGANFRDLAGPAKNSAVDALKFYTAFGVGENAVWNETLDNSTLAFAKGTLPLYFGYSWDIFTIKGINANLQFVTAPVPKLAGRSNTVASYWAEGVTARSKNSAEAFEFLTYLSKPETLQKIYQTQSKVRLFGALYPRKSMAPLLSSNELVYPFVSQADNAQSTFFSSDTLDGENGMISQMNVYLGNAVRSIANNVSPETAIDTLAQGVAQILAKY